ncbi:MAG TPA: DUF551 domain-containing protein [Puia sp.]|jgi:hypothetical protein|nr:DUF551 domain-containing protein [Puia sp.]
MTKTEIIFKHTNHVGEVDIEAAMEEYALQGSWVSVEERLPEFDSKHGNVMFVLGVLNEYPQFAKKLYYHRSALDMNKLWFDPESRRWVENSLVTHWMPLPSPPSPDKTEKL